MKIIDISMALEPGMIRWPGSPELKIQRYSDIKRGNPSNNTLLEMDVHCGTHIDAPLHFSPFGKSIDSISLNRFIGSVYVADIPNEKLITDDILKSLGIPLKTKRLLLKTDNSRSYESSGGKFDEKFVALSPEGAKWVIDFGIELIGIDYLSVQQYGSPDTTHNLLLEADIPILEGINLHGVRKGWYNLICLPLKIIGTEGSPARAVLIGKDE